MTHNYKKYDIGELRRLANAKEPTPINMVLDRKTVDFLLDLNTNNRRLNPSAVDSFLRSYDKIGWKCSESLCVTNESTLGNGQHRLTGLKRRGYPAGICATVVFGVDRESMLCIDQHSKRSATAAVKIAAGRDCRKEMLAAIRFDMLCDQDAMLIGSTSVQPSELIDRLAEWETYMLEMPLLFHAQTIGTKKIALTSSMVIAIVHYRQRAGLVKANDFLRGFWGDVDRPASSPERKAMNYRLTTTTFRGHSAITSIYRLFAWLLIAHYENRKNPRLIEASDWGVLRNKRTR